MPPQVDAIKDTQLRLIVVGKILNDSAAIGSFNIKEKDFLVVMVSKVSSISRF